MKTWIKVALGLAVVAGLAWGGTKWFKQRQQQALTAQQQAAEAKEQTKAVVELAPGDVTPAKVRPLVQGLPISGSLRATQWALVKARVAGELQGLTLREGDSVKEGQVVARIESADFLTRIRQAREQAEVAKAQIDIAQRQWDNNKALVDQGFISRTALDNSQANLSMAQSNYKAALAAVDLANKAMDDTILRAPISGVVSQRLAQPGERVGVDARIVEIVDMSNLELEATVTAADSLQLRLGQTASLKIEGTDQPFSAKLIRINPTAQSASRTVLAYLSINDSRGLRQGLFAQGRIESSAAPVLSVPLTSVRTDKPAPYVQVVEAGRVSHRNVQLGVRGESGGETLVEVKGIVEKTLVLAGHVGALREGIEIKFTGKPAPVATAPSAAASK